MRKRLAKLPSPAMVVAFMALLAALTGTAFALPGSNVVSSGDIINGAVKTQDIRNGTVRGRDVRNNTLTGSDVNEGSLRTVPSASSAGFAGTANAARFAGAAAAAGSINGATIIPIEAQSDSAVTLFNAAGLGLTLDCASETLDATTSKPDSEVRAQVTDTDSNEADGSAVIGGEEGDTFSPGTTLDLLADFPTINDQLVNIEYSAGDLAGKVSISLQLDEINEAGTSLDCGATGHAIVSN